MIEYLHELLDNTKKLLDTLHISKAFEWKHYAHAFSARFTI